MNSSNSLASLSQPHVEHPHCHRQIALLCSVSHRTNLSRVHLECSLTEGCSHMQKCGSPLVKKKGKESLASLCKERGQPLLSFQRAFYSSRFYLLFSHHIYRAGHLLLVHPPQTLAWEQVEVYPPKGQHQPQSCLTMQHLCPAPLYPLLLVCGLRMCEVPFLVWDNKMNDRRISSCFYFFSLEGFNPYSPSSKNSTGDSSLASCAPKPPT